MMEIEQVIICFICTGLLIVFSLFCWNKLEPFYKNKKQVFLLWLILSIIITIVNSLFLNPYKTIISFIILILFSYFIIYRQIKKTIILVLISQLIIFISEFSFAIISSLLYKGDIQQLTQQSLVFIGLNIYIMILSFVLSKLGFAKLLYDWFTPQKSINKDKDPLIYSFIIVTIMIVATIETYMNLPFTVVVITNTIMAAFFIGIIIASKKLKENYEKINSKYETSINSLKEYEVMIDKFRVDTHENKNEFLTIRNMIKDSNDHDLIIKYIDKLVDNKIKDNDKIMKQTAKIPSGGLRATIYSKLCLMDKLKIKYKLNISREVRTTDLINLDEELILKVCKILGVFLDNAIEAVKDLKKKTISIEIYTIDNYLCVDITNNFKGNLDIKKITETKYSTKGTGHGYGLTLVNKLLNEEKGKLENEKSIVKDMFTQTLKIKN